MAGDYEQLHVETRAEWRQWLERNHETAPGVWLVSWKAAAGRPAVGYEPAVEEALCFGWVDSQGRRLDGERSELRFTPRKPTSRWARANKERVARLERERLMRPAGLAVIEQAKANGAWTALDQVERLIVPGDLAAAFERRPGSRENWDGFPRSVRRAMLEWIVDAKRPATREKRLAETASEAERGRRANQRGERR